ncbi:MAG: alpha/beta hydrolase [Rhodobacteraceae bacterium]|nr:alpha/beta hydrolase [Paracoccaceae bacterium]
MPLEVRAGHRSFWQSFGEGARPALAIHCSLAHSGVWAGVGGRLAERIRMTAFDLPGHGQSADWAESGDYLRDSVGIASTFVDGTVDLIGHSFGAVVALRLAIDRPDVIRTLTLVEPVLFAAARRLPEWDMHAEEMADFDRAMAAGAAEDAAAAFTRVWGTGVDWRDMNAAGRADITRRIGLIAAGHPALFDDSGGILRPGAIEALEMPVLLIRGDRSPRIIARIADEIAARLPDVGVATVPGAGHMVPITHPDETAGLIGVNLDRG